MMGEEIKLMARVKREGEKASSAKLASSVVRRQRRERKGRLRGRNYYPHSDAVLELNHHREK